MPGTPVHSLDEEVASEPIRVLVCSVKPLRPTVTGARLLFDSIAGYFLESGGGPGFSTVVAVAGPLSASETTLTASIDPAVRVLSAHVGGRESFLPDSPTARALAAARFVAGFLFGRRPIRLRSGWVDAAARHFRQLADTQKPDVVIACGQDSATVARLGGVSADVVLFPSLEVDAASTERGALAALDRRALRVCERRAVDASAAVVVSTEVDRAWLIDHVPAAADRIHVIPHGIAIATSDPGPSLAPTANAPEVLIVGSLSYPPNAEAAELAYDAVLEARESCPNVTLRVVGNSAGAPIRFESAREVTLVGVVDDLQPEYQRSIGALAPVCSGGGGRIKVLEALANGLPVATTPLGLAGLISPTISSGESSIPGVWAGSRDEPVVRSIATAICEWCDDPIRASQAGLEGQQWVAERFAEPVIAARWHQLVRSVSHRTHGTQAE